MLLVYTFCVTRTHVGGEIFRFLRGNWTVWSSRSNSFTKPCYALCELTVEIEQYTPTSSPITRRVAGHQSRPSSSSASERNYNVLIHSVGCVIPWPGRIPFGTAHPVDCCMIMTIGNPHQASNSDRELPFMDFAPKKITSDVCTYCGLNRTCW